MTKAVIFDLDGTLVDSAPEIRDAVNCVLAVRGLEALDLATIISFVGNGLPTLIRLVMAARGIAEDDFQIVHDEVLEIYSAADGSLTRPYDGAHEALVWLADQGVRIGLCTNKPEAAARHVLDVFGWSHLFEVVIGGDSLAWRKPDPRPLAAVHGALGRGPVLYVGDSEIDAQTAEAAGMTFALFTEGYRKAEVDQLTFAHKFSSYVDFAEIVTDTLDLIQET
ncbi:MAG: phosphoglycolate phosphatase [Shimia sp.]|jgi:phosphoglycolate phosphatase|uniref:phosphoglycolate phosphatase n=1 Tax=Shimia sp. TaxID=1954381 RepID=UPI004057F218